LGQLVAGVAHEINNPVNFISGNLTYATEYFNQLSELLLLYQREYPQANNTIEDYIQEIELDFLTEDLSKLLSSMQLGAKRICEIVLTLRNFSRLDEAEMKPVDIHEGIESTLLILQHRFKDRPNYPSIKVVKTYGNLPLVNCYASQLNQVFMNIISNGIDALQESINQSSIPTDPKIYISTEIIDLVNENSTQKMVMIRIADNGPGIPPEIQQRLFDPFFTTKPIGTGTGLGLSISYAIVVDKHGGQLTCSSLPGKRTEFTIKIPLICDESSEENQPILFSSK
ncbi:MAG: sensor histidine kinase, partial [Planktothrix sp.]